MVLQSLGITRLKELAVKTEGEVLKSKNCNRLSLKELKEVLAEHGLTFGMNFD
jgi:DNA-directed RNA polymerase alpha subunit